MSSKNNIYILSNGNNIPFSQIDVEKALDNTLESMNANENTEKMLFNLNIFRSLALFKHPNSSMQNKIKLCKRCQNLYFYLIYIYFLYLLNVFIYFYTRLQCS